MTREGEKRSKKAGWAAGEGGGAGERCVSWLLGLARARRKPNNELCLRKSTTTLSGVLLMTMGIIFRVFCVCIH